MIVTCSVCRIRYLVDPRALGPSGRMVRCAQCSNTWFQSPPPEEVPADVASPPPPPIESRPPGPAPASVVPPLEGPERPEERIQLPAVPRRPRRIGVAIGWILLVLIVAGVVGGGYFGHDQVVRMWPASARLYALLGISAPQPNEVLQVKAVPRRDEENGVPRLVIEGEVINISPDAQTVPKLRVLLKDANDRVVQSWTFSVSTERLLPGASVPFTTSVTRPSEAATGMVVDFVDGNS